MNWQDLETNFRAALARAYVRVVGANRELSWILFDIFLPIISVAAYVYIYRSLNARQELIGYVILGGAMVAFWYNVLWSMASQFYWEKETGNLELFLVAPISRMSILAGMAIGGIYTTMIRAGAAFIVGSWIFAVPFHVSSWWLLILIFILTMTSLYGLGMMGSSLYFLYGREAWHTSSLFQEPVTLLSGFYFPVKSLGFYVSAFASLIPITLGLDGMRQIMYGTSFFSFLPLSAEMIILAVLSVFFIMLARRALNVMERLGRREGRLTLRWQ